MKYFIGVEILSVFTKVYVKFNRRSSVVRTQTSVREITGSVQNYIKVYSLERISHLLYTKHNKPACGQKTKQQRKIKNNYNVTLLKLK